MGIKKGLQSIFAPRPGEHGPDKKLLWVVGILVLFGLVMLSSASSIVSYSKFGNIYHYLVNQLFGVGVGAALFFFAYRFDYHLWRRYALFFLFVSILLLVLVFIPGLRAEHGTARSWIIIFGHSFQPSELVKISFLLYLATWLEAKKGQLSDWSSGMLPFLLILGVISGLMIAQPDLGTLFIIIATAIAVFFVGGGKVSHLLVTGALGAGALILMLNLGSSDYQSDRFKCLQDPNYSSQDKCYQINQSLIAVGSGGILGRGLGQSRQKYLYLPEVWGDAIFPIIAEELGFVISVLFILLLLFLFWRGITIARGAPDMYGAMLSVGIVVWVSVQSFLNIGGMINLIPMTGVPLPFISAGGSSIMSMLLAMGLLANISKQTKYDGR